MSQEPIKLSDLDTLSSEEIEELTKETLEKFIIQLESVEEKNVKQQMNLLQLRIILLKKELLSPTTAAVLLSKSPKRNIFLTWAELLESQHELELENKLQPTIKEIGLISSHIKNEMKSIGVVTQMTWVHETLPHKYKIGHHYSNKEDNKLDDVYRREDSSLNTKPEEENKILIDLIDKEIKIKQSIKNKLRTSHFLALLSEDDQKIVKETYLKANAIIDITGDLFDDRVSCPKMLQHLLLAAHIEGTDNFAAGIYVNRIKDFGANRWQEAKKLFEKQYKIIEAVQPEIKKLMRTLNKLDPKSKAYKEIKAKLKPEEFKVKQANLTIKAQKDLDTMTSKQTMKVMERKMKNLLPILEPPNRDDAISIGYYGLRCEGCGSFRTYRDVRHGVLITFCMQCDYTSESKFASKCISPACAFPFYDDVVKVMISTFEKEFKKLEKITSKQAESNESQTEKEKQQFLDDYNRYTDMKEIFDAGAIPCKCPRCETPVVFSKKYLFKVIH
ncbi:MAG: hypothetical protein JKY15_01825 [Deltaproteobacteria bacterium]|nr:hypothetical protein [Deltaproteobacteria bacterium]